MGNIGREGDGVPGADFHVLAVNGEAEFPGAHIGALQMGMGVHCAHAALFKVYFHDHQLLVICQHNYHEDQYCDKVKDRYLPLTEITYGELNTTYSYLTPCSGCAQIKTKAEIDALNAANGF